MAPWTSVQTTNAAVNEARATLQHAEFMRHDSRPAAKQGTGGEHGRAGTGVDARGSNQLRGHRYETTKALQGEGAGAAATPRPSAVVGRQDSSEIAASALLDSHGAQLQAGAQRVGVPAASVAAIVLAEQGALGALAADAMAMRFEPYVFWQQTGRWVVATHRDQGAEQAAFREARSIDEGAALGALRMGMAQVAGSEAIAAGYPDATTMFLAFEGDTSAQLEGLFGVIAADAPLQQAMKDEDWAVVAAHRAGPAWVALGYDDALAAGAAAWTEVSRGYGGDDDETPSKPGRGKRKP